jgi:tetratricopeptide (TPR) repeat protein
MSAIETLQNTIISHLNNHRFVEAEQQLEILRSQFGNQNGVLADVLSKIAKHSKIQVTKKLSLLKEAHNLVPHNSHIANSYAGNLAKCKNYEEAYSVFEQLLNSNPSNGYALNNYGKALADNGNYDKACKIFEQSLSINPGDLFALNSYGKALADNGNYDKAYKEFERSLSIKPDDIFALNCYGKALADNGNYDIACKIFERSLNINSDDIFALSNYGKALANKSDYSKACEVFERFLKVKPDDIIVLNSYARTLAKNRNYNEAFIIFESILNIKNDDFITLSSYGKALYENGDYEKSCEIFERSLKIKCDDIITLTGYGNALAESGKYEKSYEVFEHALKINPDNSYTVDRYAQVLIRKGDYEKSFEVFENALKIDPSNINFIKSYQVSLSSYRYDLIKNGVNDTEIIKTFEKSLQLDSNNVITLTGYATFLSNNDNFSKASELFEKALRLNSQNPILLASYGTALAKYNLYEEACNRFEHSLDIAPDNILSLTNYGKALTKNKQIDKAIIQFRKVLAIYPEDNIAKFLCANVLQEQGEYIKAITEFKTIDINKLNKGLDDLVNINLGRLYYQIKQPTEGRKYFDFVLQNSSNQEAGKLRIAANILATQPFSAEGINMLKEIIETSPKYQQARQLLALNLDAESHFEAFKTTEQESHTDTASLNRALYHKIQNEIAILKELVYDFISDFTSEELIFTRILNNITNIFEGIKQRRNQEESKIKAIPNNSYTELLTIISQTAHDVTDFVGNKLSAIYEDIWESLSEIDKTSPLYDSLNQLLQRIENTKIALNDLKAVNEGIRIKNTQFTVAELFSSWVNTPRISHAHIHINLVNAQDIIISDKEKIKSFLNELVENSLKHNADKNDLIINMKAEKSNNPNISSFKIHTQKYLHIIFSDNGKGISQDKKDWIFLPLTTTSAKGEGSGLGLFMINRILKELHGYISESGDNGVKFDIYIPYEP